MTKKFFFTTIITGAVCIAKAATISPEQALERFERSGMKKSVRMVAKARYAETLNNLYVFNTDKG
ncbi:MAG: hypothetical protein K2H98_00495, partial [Duncaniella sp.]|nr:hypothetical protein [Duncaniella sp.]